MRRPTGNEVAWLLREMYEEDPSIFWLVGMAAAMVGAIVTTVLR